MEKRVHNNDYFYCEPTNAPFTFCKYADAKGLHTEAMEVEPPITVALQ